jgi:spermidine synthase
MIDENQWLVENVDGNEKRAYRIVERLFSKKSKYQLIEVIRLANQGVSLILDGYARVFESDEYIFHEALIHPCLMLHPNPVDILLIGDGDGGGIREIFKYNSVNRVDWVEIDDDVVEVSKTYLNLFDSSLLEKPMLHTHWLDGVEYIQSNKIKYDCVIISVTEQMQGNVSSPFYSLEIISQLPNLLKEGGICVQSSGVAAPNMSSNLIAQAKRYQDVFKDVKLYTVGLPSFGLDWGFCISSSRLPLDVAIKDEVQLKYYSKAMHNRMFTLPSFLEFST